MFTNFGRDPEQDTLLDNGMSVDENSNSILSRPLGSMGIARCAFNMCNVIIGTGVIGLPYAMRNAGAAIGLLLLIVIGCITDYSLRLLIETGRQAQQYDYESLARHCFGHRGFQLILATIFILDFGAMVSCLLVIASSLPPVFQNYFGVTGVWLKREFVIVLSSFLVLLPLSLFRSLRELSVVSILSVAVISLVVLVVGKEGLAVQDRTADAEMVGSKIFVAFGSIVFAYVCHDVSFQVFQTLSTPTVHRWSLVVHLSLAIALTISIFMALLGYFSFFDLTKANILDNFDPKNAWANVARLCLCLTLLLTYPLYLFMCRHVLSRAMGFPSALHLNIRGHVLTTVLIFTLSVAVALIFPDLGVVQSLVGGLSGNAIAFIYPASFAIKVRLKEEGGLLKPGNIPVLLLAVFGVVAMLLSVIQTSISWSQGEV